MRLEFHSALIRTIFEIVIKFACVETDLHLKDFTEIVNTKNKYHCLLAFFFPYNTIKVFRILNGRKFPQNFLANKNFIAYVSRYLQSYKTILYLILIFETTFGLEWFDGTRERVTGCRSTGFWYSPGARRSLFVSEGFPNSEAPLHEWE